jgi:hypothetical protein
MNSRTLVVAGMVVLAALTRLVEHPPNFWAGTALALFGAAYLPSRKLALVVPVVAVVLSDLWLEVLTRMGWVTGWMVSGRGFHPMMWVIYGTTVLIALLGFTLRKHRTIPAVAGVTLLGSVIFFVVTNFGVWCLDPYYPQTLYPRTAAGLWECYFYALPFFRNQLLGDAFYVGLMFGGFALAERRIPALAQPGQ